MNPAAAGRAVNHVVAMPYPGRGHINPMMNLCHSLALRSKETLFTVVITEEWFGFIGSQSKPDNIKFATIPNVIPYEHVRAADMVTFIKAVQTKMEEPFEQLLNGLEPPVKLIISDTSLQWTVLLGNRRNIPVASFWIMSASVFSIVYHFELLVQNNHFPVNLSERGNELVDYIPGLSALRIRDLPHVFTKKDENTNRLLDAFSLVRRAQYLLFASVYDLESEVIDALRPIVGIPIFSVGPNIPFFQLQSNSLGATNIDSNNSYCSKWLDTKSPGSVLYISNGSFLSVSSAQMDEIAAGLKESGVPFLWVAQGEASHLNKLCAGVGVVVPWCDQLGVLCHSSIGGFWTHCGWNSIMENAYAGVPLITSPIMFDQIPNRKVVVEDWKIGCKVKDELANESWVTREEIVELVRRFMDPKTIERKDMLVRAKELRHKTRQAIENGGSSDMNLDAFIRNILQC
uniref:UGT16 n=1 Tax=Panax ginseng TaxID=4054 RepID=A0A068J5X1_PANGI|nr:UGT16 [Panax ginseng]